MGTILKNLNNFIAKHNIHISAFLNTIIQPYTLYNLNQKKWWPDDVKDILDIKTYLFLYFVLLTIVAYNIGIKHIKMDFEKLNEKLLLSESRVDFVLSQIQSCIYSSLIEFSRKLELEKEDIQQDRITVFGLKDIAGVKKFFGLSRYSDNPNYRDLSNKEYDIQKGCMAKGYSNGWHVEKGNIPSFEEKPKEYENYFRQHYGLNHSDVRTLSMPSRYYASVSIKKGAEEKGVLVFESLRPNRFDDTKIRNELEYLASKVGDLMELLDIKEEKVSQTVMNDINNLVKSRGNQ